MRRRQVLTADLQRQGLSINKPISRFKNKRHKGELNNDVAPSEIKREESNTASVQKSTEPADSTAPATMHKIIEDKLKPVTESTTQEQQSIKQPEPAKPTRTKRLSATVNESDHTSINVNHSNSAAKDNKTIDSTPAPLRSTNAPPKNKQPKTTSNRKRATRKRIRKQSTAKND